MRETLHALENLLSPESNEIEIPKFKESEGEEHEHLLALGFQTFRNLAKTYDLLISSSNKLDEWDRRTFSSHLSEIHNLLFTTAATSYAETLPISNLSNQSNQTQEGHSLSFRNFAVHLMKSSRQYLLSKRLEPSFQVSHDDDMARIDALMQLQFSEGDLPASSHTIGLVIVYCQGMETDDALR